jgi:hypothetical protein
MAQTTFWDLWAAKSRDSGQAEATAKRRRGLTCVLGLMALLAGAGRPLPGQVNTGEIRLHVMDAAGVGVRASVEVTGNGEELHKQLSTDAAGSIAVEMLPYGVYRVEVAREGFAAVRLAVAVRSAIPVEREVRLGIAPVKTKVNVDAGRLVDLDAASAPMRIGTAAIEDRVGSLPGRSVEDLVNAQPGWLYEGNAVLHPRGSEYQTQFVVDGIPLTDNRSPSFGPEIEADDMQSLSIYTAGIPAEYGRKMGGVVEVNTHPDGDPGLHGRLVLSGGSYDTAGSYGQVQEVWAKNALGASAAGSMTSHYLNPVVPENYTNKGTTGDFSASYQRELSEKDRVSFSVRHELARFLIPNELVQEEAGQVQSGDNFETMGTVRYQHIFSAESLASLSGMVRDNANDLYSNAESTPIIAFQHNHFREGYFKGTMSVHHGVQEWKFGVESDTAFLYEDFRYTLTDPTQFDDNTPESLVFRAQRPDLEESVFVEDAISLGRWNVSAGLRWDHYQLLLNQSAFSPRLSLARSFSSANLMLHASFDRVFQTPSFEDILISSSTQIEALDAQFLRLSVQPSRGNYYEGGLSEGVGGRLRLDANVYRRDVRNYADDDQLLNTGVSYPIAFDRSVIYGAEAKLDLVRWGRASGFVSYSYMVGNAWYPVTGGLFLGDDAAAALQQTNGHFPDSQDQRNTLRTRFSYQAGARVWFAAGANFGSGLPFEYEGDESDALAQYGAAVISRLNFDRGRVRPLLDVNASSGVTLYEGNRMQARLQVDGENLNNRLNVIDFGGLFSGNAIAPARSFALRLTTHF